MTALEEDRTPHYAQIGSLELPAQTLRINVCVMREHPAPGSVVMLCVKKTEADWFTFTETQARELSVRLHQAADNLRNFNRERGFA